MDAEIRRRIDEYNETIAKGGAAHVYTRLADLYRQSGMLGNSVDTAKAGLEIHPGSLSIQQALGLSYADLGESEAAVKLLAPIVEKLPDNGSAAYGLALALSRMGRDEDAMKVLHRRLEKDPLDKDCIELLRLLESGEGAPLPPRGQEKEGRTLNSASTDDKDRADDADAGSDDYMVTDVDSLFKPGDELLPDEIIDLETVFDEEPRPLEESNKKSEAKPAHEERTGVHHGAEGAEAIKAEEESKESSGGGKPAGFFKRLFGRKKKKAS